ncbi:UDP-N-acetylglucosamine 2-epimerase [Anaerovorax odorimutans]|uniref:UDP-N-acetylglucosamine 2-epimerase n=1 Tax=Anaerovorax odorimutans TaxID=109327 RepID=UPI000411E39D|nr:UDP-N-acetylglucosamine 2-epimerase [Anaerovorax odorimutans]
MKTICVVTGTRAEYGLLKPVIEKINDDSDLELRLAVTGMHLCSEFGYTIKEIHDDGFKVDEKIECVLSSDTIVGMTKSTAMAMFSFSEYFNRRNPDMLILLGDRYEIFACAVAAAMAKIPIAHLYGGDTTEGAVDEFMRHSITKMSYLHFVSNEQSKKRVQQLGENPKRVFNVGATGIENILKMKLLSKEQLEESLDFKLNIPYALVTFHPVTMEYGNEEKQLKELFNAMEKLSNINFIFTKANSDAKGRIINKMVDEFVKDKSNCIAFNSLGTLKYLSAMKYAKMVIGNSSSGIYEAPSFHIPTINIGNRQKGRLQAKSIINCNPKSVDIIEAINKASQQKFINSIKDVKSPLEGENTSENIVKIIKQALMEGNINLEKEFYDMR